MYHLYVESKKLMQMKLFKKQKQTYRHRKQTYVYQKEKVERRDKLGSWEQHIHTTIHKIDKQQGPTI